VKARGMIKARITRARNWIRIFDIQSHSIEEVEVRLDAIQRAWEEFRETQDALEDLDAEFENDGERETFESEYYTASAAAKALIARHGRGRISMQQNRDVGSQGIGNMNDPRDRVKLPPINMPTFNGSYDQWPNFRDIFKAVIDENRNLSDIKKLYYLRLALKDAAAEILESMEMTADNYDVAWNLLENRYENKRILVHHHIQALIDQPGLQKESPTGLRQLLDHTEKHVRALKKLGEPTEHWGTILVHLMTAKFDNITKREWETKTPAKEVATYQQFIDFTTNRCVMLETLQLDKAKFTKSVGSDLKTINANKKSIAAAITETKSDKCLGCNQANHRLYHCPSFLNLTPQARGKEVKRLKLCFNCFKVGHNVETCSSSTCRLCHKKHNTLLHISNGESSEGGGSGSPSATVKSQPLADSQSTSVVQHVALRNNRGLLATARLQDNHGNFQEGRAFLDPGSQSNFITKELCERLGLPQRKNYMTIRGIDNVQTTTLTETHATIQSKVNAFRVKLAFSVLPAITASLSLSEINQHHLQIPATITLADLSFHTPGKIDILLGSTIFWELLCVGQIKLGKNQLIAQKTKLGWIIAGPLGYVGPTENSMASGCSISNTAILEKQLERFWQVEEGIPSSEPSENDEVCETEFARTHKRNAEGRFEVRLPLCDDINRLGDSREIAIKRLRYVERRFMKSPELKQQYTLFMQEYEELKHMSKISNHEGHSGTIVYLPHQAVLKPDSSSTKVRVVFDASSPTSSGVSLNNILRIGPIIQQDLLSIILRFRRHQFVITADIKQMYRQVLLQEDQRDLQRILWRPEAKEPICEYRFNTVTYGMASAPFLAIRCLHQLANENQDKYPEASRVILNDFYVDDLLTGSDELNALRQLKRELTEILQSAGFFLHKWNTNAPVIFEGSAEVQELPKNEEVKTLGICWNTTDDCLQYRMGAVGRDQRITKRTVLSTIAQIYDPLGLMGPVIIRAKIIL